MQLGESHEVGTVDEQGVGGGDVDAGLDDRRAHQDVGATLPEIHHDLLELFLGHLAVGGEHPGLGNEFADLLGRLLDGLHPIVDEEHLPLAGELTPDGGDDLALVVGAGKGEHRMAFLRRGGDGTHLTNTRHRHLQGAGNRGGAHGEHVDIDAQLLESLLVLDTEALLLVDDDQSQVVELHLAAQQSVGADDDVHRAAFDALPHCFCLGIGLEPRQCRDIDREAGVAFGEGLQMLLDE